MVSALTLQASIWRMGSLPMLYLPVSATTFVTVWRRLEMFRQYLGVDEQVEVHHRAYSTAIMMTMVRPYRVRATARIFVMPVTADKMAR